MNIEVEGGRDVGVTQEYTDCFVVAVALNTTSSKRVTESVELDWRDTERFHQPLIVRAICTRFNGLAVIGYDIEISIDDFHKRLDERESFRTERYFAHGIRCLGVIDY